MIKYTLSCQKGHEFESWFAGSDGFDKLAAAGQIECPQCGSIKVSKALMAPSVSTARKKEASRKTMRANAASAARAATGRGELPAVSPPPVPQPSGPPATPVALLDENQRKLRAELKELHKKIAETTVDVGENFPAEARKIHDGEAPERPIRGQASLQDAKELWEDGIPVLPLPPLPDEKN